MGWLINKGQGESGAPRSIKTVQNHKDLHFGHRFGTVQKSNLGAPDCTPNVANRCVIYSSELSMYVVCDIFLSSILCKQHVMSHVSRSYQCITHCGELAAN